jgi:hypothetical protein
MAMADSDRANAESGSTFTYEEADRLVTAALDTDLNEPEPFIKLLLVLYDRAREPDLKDSVYLLMKAAYDNSIVHSINFQEYLEAIRRCQKPLEEAPTRWYGSREPEA